MRSTGAARAAVRSDLVEEAGAQRADDRGEPATVFVDVEVTGVGRAAGAPAAGSAGP
jgi:hypothetical protein